MIYHYRDLQQYVGVRTWVGGRGRVGKRVWGSKSSKLTCLCCRVILNKSFILLVHYREFNKLKRTLLLYENISLTPQNVN